MMAKITNPGIMSNGIWLLATSCLWLLLAANFFTGPIPASGFSVSELFNRPRLFQRSQQPSALNPSSPAGSASASSASASSSASSAAAGPLQASSSGLQVITTPGSGSLKNSNPINAALGISTNLAPNGAGAGGQQTTDNNNGMQPLLNSQNQRHHHHLLNAAVEHERRLHFLAAINNGNQQQQQHQSRLNPLFSNSHQQSAFVPSLVVHPGNSPVGNDELINFAQSEHHGSHLFLNPPPVAANNQFAVSPSNLQPRPYTLNQQPGGPFFATGNLYQPNADLVALVNDQPPSGAMQVNQQNQQAPIRLTQSQSEIVDKIERHIGQNIEQSLNLQPQEQAQASGYQVNSGTQREPVQAATGHESESSGEYEAAEHEAGEHHQEAAGEPQHQHQASAEKRSHHEPEHHHHHHHHQHHEHQHHEHQHEHPPEAFEIHHKKGGKSFQYFHQGHHH